MDYLKELKKELTQEELEIQSILLRADENRAESLFIDGEGELNTVDEIKRILIPSDTDDPVLKHEYFYQGIQKILNKELPKGISNKEFRDLIREEINIFLTRGKTKKAGRRGADVRMAFITDMEIALENLIQWKADRESFVNLFTVFSELNKKYREENKNDTSQVE